MCQLLMHILFSRDFMYSILCVRVICKIILTRIFSEGSFLSVLFWRCGNRTEGRERVKFVGWNTNICVLKMYHWDALERLFLFGSFSKVNADLEFIYRLVHIPMMPMLHSFESLGKTHNLLTPTLSKSKRCTKKAPKSNTKNRKKMKTI